MSPDVTRLGRGQLQTRLCAKPQAGDGKAADESPNGQVLDPSRGTLKRWENCRRKPKYDLKIIEKKWFNMFNYAATLGRMISGMKYRPSSRPRGFGASTKVKQVGRAARRELVNGRAVAATSTMCASRWAVGCGSCHQFVTL